MAIKTKSRSHLFRSYRALRGLSQQDVAEALGEPQHYVSFLETGKALPPPKIARKICRLLEAPMEELFPDSFFHSAPHPLFLKNSATSWNESAVERELTQVSNRGRITVKHRLVTVLATVKHRLVTVLATVKTVW